MKRYYLWIFLALCFVLITWKLFENQQKRQEETALALATRLNVPVKTALVAQEKLANRLDANGIFLPAKEMFVISETQGRVVQVLKNKGEWVNEGDLIAKVDDELLTIELQATQANIAKMKKDRERLGNLIEGEAAPKNKMEDIELGLLAAETKEKALKKQIANTSIRAPMTGTLGLRFVERGSVIGPGIQVAQVTNLEHLLLMVKVTERDVLHVRAGQRVRVTADVYSQHPIAAQVTNIGLRADNAFKYDVEIKVPNPKGAPLRAGMHAQAQFVFDAAREGLTIPRNAIEGSLLDAAVFVVRDSVAERRSVQLGGVFDDRVEVLSGLSRGERVVITGQFNLTNGTRVVVVDQ
ncbi:MAG: efflux RND transporter periplasmic adaptor subunit [Saprospiraceae bacterium]